MEGEKDLKPIVSLSDKILKEKISIEDWDKIKNKTFRDSNFKCQGCGFEPFDIDVDEVLDAHLISINEENLLESNFKTLCKLCHIIEHADAAIKNDYVEMVNSHFKQSEIVNICRSGELRHYIDSGDIRILKKTKEEFLDELYNGKNLEGKVKFIFTEKYLEKINF